MFSVVVLCPSVHLGRIAEAMEVWEVFAVQREAVDGVIHLEAQVDAPKLQGLRQALSSCPDIQFQNAS